MTVDTVDHDYISAEAEILAELAELGIPAQSLREVSAYIKKRRRGFRQIAPVMVRWLATSDHVRIQESLARCLGVNALGPVAEKQLVATYRSMPPEYVDARWGVASAISEVASPAIEEDLLDLAADTTAGRAREMLVVALGRIHTERSTARVLSLLGDEQVNGHALAALGKLAVPSTESSIEPFLGHKVSWKRKEARKALDRIAKAKQREQSGGN